jgi:OmcA/MtrC family decaheme c-type cytochrome
MVGNADYSTVHNPSPTNACAVCHEPQSVSGATQANNWFTKPARDTCGSCHDNVNFATGANHADLPQISDNLCANCHPPQGEIDFDTSIKGAHVVPAESSLLGGVRFTIDAVSDVAPGKMPTVSFTVKDKAGQPLLLSQMNNLRIYMGGPTSDIAGYVREDALRAQGPGGGIYYWTFNTPIPAAATGSWMFGIEGYRNTTVLQGTLQQRTIRDVGPNQFFTASLDGSKPQPRRTVVSDAKCDTCHHSLSAHGGNRNSAIMCVFCHNPRLTEGANRESWNYVNMIHRVHEEARYPGVLTNCSQCHEADSQSLPLPSGLRPVANGLAPVDPTPPVTNACMVCHNTTTAWSHAAANTTQLGESCAVCHGRDSDLSVNKVHAQ